MLDFDYFIEALDKLKRTSKTSEKLAILNEIKETDVEFAQDFFSKCLDNKYQFGLKQIPNYVGPEPDRVSMYHLVECAYDRLLHDKTDLKTFIKEVMKTLTKDEYRLFTLICKKDPSCGVSVALVNRVWPGLISCSSKVCKAVPYSEKALERIKFPCYAQKKEDGARCLCFIESDSVTFKSANGKEYTGLTKLAEAILKANKEFQEYLKTHYKETNFVLDGELLVFHNGTELPRKIGNGILNKSIKGTISEAEADNVWFIVWDWIPYEEYFSTYTGCLPYELRWEFTEKFSSMIEDCCLPVECTLANTKEDVISIFREYLAKGNEGIILKNKKFSWQGKRIPDCVKFKLDLDVTLRIKGLRHGAIGTKYENELGAIECESEDSKLTVFVGTGLSDEFRESFYATYKDYDFQSNPMFIEVRSNGIIEHSDGYSLFLPRFIEVRTDKTQADTLAMIQDLQSAAIALS